MHLHAAPWVVPIAGAPIREGGVLVDDGRIVAVGPADELRRRATSVSAYAGVLMPGPRQRARAPAVRAVVRRSRRRRAGVSGLARSDDRSGASPGERRRLARGGRGQLGAGARQRHGGRRRHRDERRRAGRRVPGVRYLESVALASDAWPEEQERLEPLLAEHRRGRAFAAHALHARDGRPHRLDRPGSPDAAPAASAPGGDGGRGPVRTRGRRPFRVWAVRGGASRRRRRTALPGGVPRLTRRARARRPRRARHPSGRRPTARCCARRGTAVALCARSNAILGAGVPPVAALLREGSPIAVGTDSLASTPDLDLLAEARALAAAAAARVTPTPTSRPGSCTPAPREARLRDRPARSRRPRAAARRPRWRTSRSSA